MTPSPSIDAPTRATPSAQPAASMAVLAAVMTIGLASLALTLFDAPVPGRALLAVAAALTIPGIPIMVAARAGGLDVQFVLGVALSLACWLLTSQLQLSTGVWSPLAGQAVLTVVALAAAMVALAAGLDDR